MTVTRSKKLLLLAAIGLIMFSLARLALFILYYDTFKDYSADEILAAFLRGVRFDGAIFFTFTAVFFAFLLFPIKNILYHKIIVWLMFPVYIFMGGFLVADVIYFGYVNRHLANEPFAIGSDMDFMADMLGVYLFQIILAVVLIGVLAFLWKKIADLKVCWEKSWKHFAAVFLVWCLAIFLVIRGTVSDKPISTIDAFVSGDSNLGSLTLNGLFSTLKYYSHQSTASADDYTFFEQEKAKATLDLYRQAECNLPLIPHGVRPNIVFILLESWSAYYTDSFGGNGFSLTPNLDSISEKGIKFMRHYAPDKRSISAIQAALTGIPPMGGLPSLGFGLETMAKGNVGKLLSDAGYDTVFIQSSRRRSFYMDSIAKSLGFKEYYGMEDTEIILDYPDKSASKFGWDYETYMLLYDVLKDKGKDSPFMAFIFTGTTHTPYPKVPDEFMKFPHEQDGENGFKNTLLYADYSLGEFFKLVQREPWFKNTIFIISADHNLGRFEKVTFPEDYRVPFIVYSPLFEGGIYVDNVTSHIDITPTIIELAGINSKDDYLGRSVFCKDDLSFAVISEWSVAGIVAKNASLKDSFGKILDYSPQDLSLDERLRLEEALLSYYQVEFGKIFSAAGAK